MSHARKSVLVVDANNLIARCIFASALDDLRASGTFTGGIYGSLMSLRSIVQSPKVRGISQIIACFDNGVPPFRLKLLPDYKKDRKARKELLSPEDRQKAMGQILKCYEIWPTLGIQCLSYAKREADDVVAAVTGVLLKQGVQPIVASSDRDLFQLVALGAHVFDLRTNDLIMRENFTEHSDGVALDDWLLYRALVGDASDGIKGCAGCGPKRAQQLLASVDFSDADVNPEDHSARLRYLCAHVRDRVRGAKAPRAFEKNLVEAEEHLKNVLRAIDLRASFGPTGKLAKRLRVPTAVDTRAFLRHCRDLQFQSILGDPVGMLDPFASILR